MNRTETPAQQEGLYVYCIALSGEAGSLGEIGIEGREVTTIAYSDLGAAVHHCTAEPYQSSSGEVVASWVMAQHRVVDAASRRWGTILPLTFNTIIKGEPGREASENLVAWLEAEYQSLKAKLRFLEGKAEYGVQVFWDPQVLASLVAQSSPEIRRLEEEIKAKPRGLAYMYRQKLESILKKATEAQMTAEYISLYNRIRNWADAIRVERPKADSSQLRMLLNLSCLASRGKEQDLEGELAEVCAARGLSARLIGPLPPYSFC